MQKNPQVLNLISSFEWDVLPSAQLDCIPWEKGSLIYCKVDLTARKLTKEQSWTIRKLDNSIAWTHRATNENEEKTRQAENRSSICYPSEMSTRSKGRTVTLLFNTVQDRGQADVNGKHYCLFCFSLHAEGELSLVVLIQWVAGRKRAETGIKRG